MSRWTWHYPVDPDCPGVEHWNETFWDEPMTDYRGCADELQDAFQRRHLGTCGHCREYAAANVEVVER